MKILALDPGKINFAFAVMEDRKVIEAGYIPCIKDLKRAAFEEESKGFRNRYFALLEKHKPDKVVAERFMARPGSNGGAVGEYLAVNHSRSCRRRADGHPHRMRRSSPSRRDRP